MLHVTFNKNSRNLWHLTEYGWAAINNSGWSFDRKTYTWSSPKSSHSWNPWNPADFTMKSGGFQVKSGRFQVKSGGFQVKSGRFQVKSSRFQVKSTPNLIKSDVSTKTLQFGGCMEGAMTPDFMRSKVIAPVLHSSNWIVFVETSDFIRFGVDFTWNLPDFMKSGRFHVKSKDHLQGIVTLFLVFPLGPTTSPKFAPQLLFHI